MEEIIFARLIAKAPEFYRECVRFLRERKLDIAKYGEDLSPEYDLEFAARIEKLLREIDPDFDKLPEATDIKAFARRVNNMRCWQKESSRSPDSEDAKFYSKTNEDLVDRILEQILQEAKS